MQRASSEGSLNPGGQGEQPSDLTPKHAHFAGVGQSRGLAALAPWEARPSPGLQALALFDSLPLLRKCHQYIHVAGKTLAPHGWSVTG